MNIENTFVAIKPDGVSRKLIGNIIMRFENAGLELQNIKLMQVSEELAKEHYGEHIDKPFFPKLLAYITQGNIIAMHWSGENSIAIIRKLVGATNPIDAAPGSIRGDHANSLDANIIHASDSLASAERELKLFFN